MPADKTCESKRQYTLNVRLTKFLDGGTDNWFWRLLVFEVPMGPNSINRLVDLRSKSGLWLLARQLCGLVTDGFMDL